MPTTPMAFAQKLQRIHELQERLYSDHNLQEPDTTKMWDECTRLREWIDTNFPEVQKKLQPEALRSLIMQAKETAKNTVTKLLAKSKKKG